MPNARGDFEKRHAEPAFGASHVGGEHHMISGDEVSRHPIFHPIYRGTFRDGPGHSGTEAVDLGLGGTLRDCRGRVWTDS